MNTKIQRLLTFIFLFSVAIPKDAYAVLWEVRNNTPTTAQVTMTFTQASRVINGVVLINFMPSFDCLPEVGFLFIEGNGRQLGEPKGQRWAKSRMTIWIDTQMSWNERTAIENYANGFGVSGMANATFLKSIKAGREAIIQPLEGTQKFSFTLEGAGLAIVQAKEHCMRYR